MANGIDNDNGNDNDNDNDNDGTSDIMQHHTIPSAPKPKPPTPRRQQSHSHSQRVDMTGQLASASVSTPDLEDFTSMFHKVLEEQGYAELTLQQQREGGSQSAASDAESTQIFNYHDGVGDGDGDGDFARQSAALVATEDRNNHNYNYKHKPSPARKASHNSATGAPASNRTRAPVGVSPKRSTSTSTSSPGRSPGSTSSSAARLAEKKRRVHEMRRLNRTIGDLNESLRERGDNSQSPRRSRSLTESRGASRPPGSTALLPKTIADVAPEAPGTTAAAAAAAAARTTTAPTTTIYETRNNGACREVVSGLPITVEHRDDKRQVSSAALLDTTTSTFSSEDGEKGGLIPTEISSLHTLCRAGVIVFAVLGIVALGIYLGYMSYMIRANNQS